jgi:hypothetical protein
VYNRGGGSLPRGEGQFIHPTATRLIDGVTEALDDRSQSAVVAQWRSGLLAERFSK